MSNKRNKSKKNEVNRKSGKKTALKVLLTILIILLLLFIAAFWYIHNKLSKVNYVELKNIEINDGVAEQLKGYRNVALFGVDSRANTYEDTRSDCIMVISINEDTKQVKITSIYRDTLVYIEGHGYEKITHAYAYGGPELAINTLNKNFDLNISEFVAVNFDAVTEIIDSIGGVDINVSSEEVAQINKNIDSLASQTGKTSPKVSRAGTQTLSGGQALAYARIRKLAGGDIKRTERMRDVLNATFSKAKNLNIAKLNKLADILLPKVYTNVKSSEILGFIPVLTSYNVDSSKGWPYNYQTGMVDRMSVVIPVNLESNVQQLHKELFGNDNYEVSAKVKEYSNTIINKTGYK